MWTVEKITETCEKYCGRANVVFNVPVVINKRLTRTLGRCIYVKRGSVVNPSRIEISYHLLEIADDASIEDVIAHECAHYVTAALTHEKHGHDETFRFYCSKIGAVSTGAATNLVYNKSIEDSYKYAVFCTKCGKFVAGRSRSCKLTQHPEDFTSNCCDAEIMVIQNW